MGSLNYTGMESGATTDRTIRHVLIFLELKMSSIGIKCICANFTTCNVLSIKYLLHGSGDHANSLKLHIYAEDFISLWHKSDWQGL